MHKASVSLLLIIEQMMNKHFVLTGILCNLGNLANAQITITDEEMQEKIVSKPMPFDSLSNITYQKDVIQYKKFIGYKLYCLPISNKYKQEKPDYNVNNGFSDLKYKSSRTFVKRHKPFDQTVEARVFGDVKKLKGNSLTSYENQKNNYENSFVKQIDTYKATENSRGEIYTPYDSIQNTYFTILNIEISEYIGASKGRFLALENWDKGSKYYLRFTLKNETSGEELYWICRQDVLSKQEFFLVPYFEKMQNLYKGQHVVPTTNLDNLVDINSGDPINIKSKEIWQCYNVTFVHSKDNILVQPYFLLNKDDIKVKIPFKDFTEKCNGIFTAEDRIFRSRFLLESEYDSIIAEKKRSAEEKQRIEEERLRIEEQARLERNKQIIKKYGNKYGKLICEGKVCLNMTKDMCIEAWGEPCYINSTIVKRLVHEQWVYWGSYLYFDNGVLTGIQN